MIQRILMTGVTGYLGSHTAIAFIRQGYEVAAIIRKSSSKELIQSIINEINLYEYNGKIDELNEIFKRVNPDILIHIAGKSINQAKDSEIEELLESNIFFGTQVLAAAVHYGVKYFINTGSYWQNFLGEDYNPVNLYAATKQAFEDICKFYLATTDLRMITLRLLDTYGPRDPRKKIIPLFTEISETGELLKMSPGRQELNLVYIEDVVKSYILAVDKVRKLEAHEAATYQVSTKEIYTLREIVKIFEAASGRNLNIVWGEINYMPRTVMKVPMCYPSILQNTKIITLYEGIKKIFSDLNNDAK